MCGFGNVQGLRNKAQGKPENWLNAERLMLNARLLAEIATIIHD